MILESPVDASGILHWFSCRDPKKSRPVELNGIYMDLWYKNMLLSRGK